MKKYIKYTESNGKEVNKEYSDEEVVRVLQQQQEIQNKSHTQMAVMFGLDFDRRNVDVLKIVLFNDKPTDNNTFTVYIADADILTDKAEWSAFSGHIEGLLINTFPEKHLYPLKERWHIMIQKLFFDFYDDDPGQGSSLSPDVDIDYKKEKLIDSYSPVNEIHDLPYDDNILLIEVEDVINYLGKRLECIKVCIQSGGFSEKYDDYLYSIIIQMNQLHKDEYCEIDIKEFLEKYDGIEKIKQTAQYVGDIISKEWPEINIFVDCTVDKDD